MYARTGWLRIPCALVVLVTSLLSGRAGLKGEGGRSISFPLPPDLDAIGTHVGAINTYVTSVTLSPPASVHRLGLNYSEIRGTIRGVGWGGSTTALLQCPYEYALPYVLRIPAGWDGGLVIYRQQFDPLESVDPWEPALGNRNFFRVIHEAGDRAVSDSALHPNRRWAFFAVNTSGVDPGGAHNTMLVDAPGCAAGTAVGPGRDTSIARDHALLAQRLLRLLRDREVTVTLGVGFVQGAVVNMSLNGGYRHPADSTPAGDNHRIPYDVTSDRIFDGFIWIDGSPAAGQDMRALSAPTIFLYGEATAGLQQGTINQLNRIVGTTGLVPTDLARVYSLRSVPLLDADWNLSLTREDIEWANAALPTPGPNALTPYFLGGGERLRPVMGALLDALAKWATEGVAPPTSLFNGDVKTAPDRIEFQRTGDPSLVFPFVDDVSIDTYASNPFAPPAPALRTAWAAVRTKLGASSGSIVLPETACRRGRFGFIAGSGPTGTDFQSLSPEDFLMRSGSPQAYDLCRVQRVDSLIGAGLYDPTFATVDVDPEHSPNVIDLRSKGRLAVAIFTTDGFDATMIVPGSLRLAGASQRGIADNTGNVKAEALDLNGDGRLDLRAEFRIDRLVFSDFDIVADVWGQTRAGIPFSGSDIVQLVR